MKKLLFLTVVASALTFSSCGTVKSPLNGIFYTDVTSGLNVTNNSLGSKVGTSGAKGVLGLVAVGDASIDTAAKKAGIKKISHVDQKASSILGIITSYEVIVYGE